MQVKLIRKPRLLPHQIKVTAEHGVQAVIDLRDMDIRYDDGLESGVEKLEISAPGQCTNVLYGFERYPGRLPRDLRNDEYRVTQCTLRWLTGIETGHIVVKGHPGSMHTIYDIITLGIDPAKAERL